jgi:hypothetical protein
MTRRRLEILSARAPAALCERVRVVSASIDIVFLCVLDEEGRGPVAEGRGQGLRGQEARGHEGRGRGGQLQGPERARNEGSAENRTKKNTPGKHSLVIFMNEGKFLLNTSGVHYTRNI